MRRLVVVVVALLAVPALAQAQGFAPESLVNTRVFPHNTPVPQVLATMRGFTQALGVRCNYCHVEQETGPGQPPKFDFPNDSKRTKLVARQMMLMLAEINRRIDTLPSRPTPLLSVGCMTCHRGVSRPVPLSNIVTETATSFNADSAVRAYRALRQRYYGRDAYDFGEESLTSAAQRVAAAGKPDDALTLVALDEEFFPNSANAAVTRGNVLLVKHDTTGAVAAFREALKRDPRAREAQVRLKDLGVSP